MGGSRKRIIGGWRAHTRYLWIIEIRQRNSLFPLHEADAFSRRQIKLNSVTIYELTDRDVATQPVQYQYRYSISIKMTEYAIDERRKLLVMNLERLFQKTAILFAIPYQITERRRFISQRNITIVEQLKKKLFELLNTEIINPITHSYFLSLFLFNFPFISCRTLNMHTHTRKRCN